LFEQARANIDAEMDVYRAERAAYDAAMEEGRGIILNIETVADLNAAAAQMGKMAHALTSKQELAKLLNDKAAGIGAAYNKEAKAYVQTDPHAA